MGEQKTEPLVDKGQVAKFLGVSTDTVDKERIKTDLPYYKLGRKVRFRISEVEAWLKQKKQND